MEAEKQINEPPLKQKVIVKPVSTKRVPNLGRPVRHLYDSTSAAGAGE